MIKIDKANMLYKQAVSRNDRCITVFTPTYNRCSLLLRVYECLRKQSNTNFVWLVVSDGSTDDTDLKMAQLIEETDIPIRYVSKENGGKHTALKLGMELTETDYFCDCDDDDTYTVDMVDFFLTQWEQIESDDKADIGVVRALTQYEDGRMVCKYRFNNKDMGKWFDTTNLEMVYIKHQIKEDHTCFRMEALRSVELWPKDYWLSCYHTFLSEGVWHGRFARKYKSRYVFKVTRIYNDTSIGIIRDKLNSQRAINAFINNHLLLNEQWDYFQFYKLLMMKDILVMGVYRSALGISVFKQLKYIEHLGLKIWILLTVPICYIIRQIKYKGISFKGIPLK